ncbi:hypothetical protein K503DRAFT_226110 [Rhizopogon vinicolor AM-OR11-026]|uniref:F-box domain-containing protein n=1 Tax=Rhizopogon vinicolor AM-OR11-026 TaxID=1314800 RepID=A0A1B7MY94_9AGAM|nr:hypothetical protein K503DRAFT_226110 [Rhizopogon vinicolor AM-OR11-026]
MTVCVRWKRVLLQIPSICDVMHISFRKGAVSLERVRTFLRRSGTRPLYITLLWDDHNWIPVSVEYSDGPEEPTSREEIMAGVHLVLVIQELYAHVHRWREFTLRTTSVVQIYQALSLMSRPSIHPAHMLEKLHLQLIHNKNHATHHRHEQSLFPSSTPPIRDLLLFGVTCDWLPPSMLSSHLLNFWIHNKVYEIDDVVSHLFGGLPNLQSLSLEPEPQTIVSLSRRPITLPQLRSLAIKSRSMGNWAHDFLRNVCMPNLRILTLDGVGEEYSEEPLRWRGPSSHECILEALVELADRDAVENSLSYCLELDELHFFNFTQDAKAVLVHRLYKQMTAVKTLTLGPGAPDKNAALAKGLLPTPSGLADLPLPGLRTLILFDVPNDVVRGVVLERTSAAAPLKELYYREEVVDKKHKSISNDWSHHVGKYHCVDSLKSFRYGDIVERQWSQL